MICEEHRFLFIHIPKTAGTSIKEALPRCDPFFHKCDKHVVVRNYLYTHPQLFKFTFVRNPYDRMVSYYHFFKAQVTFTEFVKTFYAKSKLIYRMLPYVMDDDNNIAMDFVGRYETLQEDFDKLCGIIGIQRKELPHVNSTTHEEYHTYYDEESFELVTKMFEDDIREFNYEFSE